MPTYTGGTPVAPPLYLYYPFDESSGTTCADASGNGRDGTVASATFTAGKYNNCVSLGTLGSVSTPSVSWASPITVSLWYRATSGIGSFTSRTLVSNTSSQISLGVDLGDRFDFTPGTAGPDGLLDLTPIIANTWYHVVGTIDGSNDIQLYVNGTLQAHKEGLTLAARTSNAIGFDGFFKADGDIDDFRVYNAVLTDAQVADLFAGTAPTGNLNRTHPTLAGTGTFAPAPSTATAALSRSHPTIASTAHFASQAYTGTAALVRSHPVVASTARYALRTFTGTASLVRSHPVVAGAAVRIRPVYAGTAALSRSHPLIAATSSGKTFGVVSMWLSGTDNVQQLGMNVVIQGGSWDPASGVLPCSVAGGDQDGAFASIPLVVAGTTPALSGVMNLVLLGPDHADVSSILNLALKAGGRAVSGGVPLYLLNVPPAAAQLRLFIKGPDGTPGAIPADAAMNFWIEWGAQGVLPLIINPGFIDGSLATFIAGIDHAEGSLPLSIAGEGGVIYGTIDLSMPNVYAPTAIDGTLDLALPRSIGFLTASCTTHINGWGS